MVVGFLWCLYWLNGCDCGGILLEWLWNCDVGIVAVK